MMTHSGITWRWIAGGISFTVFLILFILRMDIFYGQWNPFGSSSRNFASTNFQTYPDRESWMNISQNGQKIGYAYRRFSGTDTGYRIVESVNIRINTMGIVQGMMFKTNGTLNPDMTLSSFDFDLRSSLFRFKAKGVVSGKKVTLYTETQGAENKTVMTLKEAPHLSNGIFEAAEVGSLKAGDSKTLHIFDPVAMTQRSVKVAVLGNETISVMGQTQAVRKVSIDFMGAKQFAWIGDNGDVLMEKGILGITLQKVTKREALRDFATATSADLTEVASIPSNVVIDDPSALTFLKLKVTGVEKESLHLHGGRQIFRNKILQIKKEAIPTRPLRETNVVGKGEYLQSSPFIQSNNPRIQEKMREIISLEDPVAVKASKLVEWVYKHVEKRPVLSVPNAVETLNNLVGDCNEHAVLLAALARAAGIPAQIEAGLVYHRGGFYYHAWNVLYLGTWVTADAVMGQMPADVTHIRLIRGEADKQIDLMGVIGKVHIKILDKSQ